MIEARTSYRARPKCDLCGWVGLWRTSTSSPSMADERAVGDLAYHHDFWHETVGVQA